MPSSTSNRIAAVCFGIAAAMATQPAVAADFPFAPGPGEEEARPLPDYQAERGAFQGYREERIEEEGPPRRSGSVPYSSRYAVGPRYTPPPPRQEECRTIIKHRINGFGEEIRRRIRICDEREPVRPGPRFRPSGYGPGPVPLADVPGESYGDPRGY